MESITPGPGGCVTTEQAAALCGVTAITVRSWINRGWKAPDGTTCKLPVAFRYRGRIMLNPVEVAKAERATAERARRFSASVAA